MTAPYGLISQHREYSYYGGWTATAVYVMPSTEVTAFILANYLDFYIASPYMEVVRITDEPWMNEDVVDSSGTSYSRKITLHFGVVYLDVPWPSSVTRPDYALGTTLKLHTTFGGQYQPIPPCGIKPAAAGPAAGPNHQLSQYIALNLYHVEWDRVSAAAVTDFTGYTGAVNSDTFMGCAPGQLLCAGARQDPSFLLDPTNAVGWKTTVTFKQRKITVAAGVDAGEYGWNDRFNEKTQKWEAVALTNGSPLYNPVAFAGMFG